jgi:cytochrome c553
MRKVLKLAAWAVGGVAGVALLAGLGAFGASEAMIRWPVEQPAARPLRSAQPGSVERGHKIAVVEGCHDCHGAGLQGQLFHDEPAIVRAWAPNLTLAAARQTDAELERAIRHGVAADGRRLWIMPSSAFAQLDDQEVADLIAYVRSFRPQGPARPRIQVGPVGRLGLMLGKFQSEPELIARGLPRVPDAGPEHAGGRALARACVECHGSDLRGGAATGAPDLMIAAAYEPEDFERLLRTGVAAGERKVGLMSQIAPVRFNAWSSAEIAELHGYLKARAQREMASEP